MPVINKPKTGLAAKIKPKQAKSPHWKGPSGEGWNGGVTQSMLSRYICCGERFRIAMVEGLRPFETFSKVIEYGQMWHTCEESFALSGNPIIYNPVTKRPWERALEDYTRKLCQKFKFNQEDILHWMNVCKVQFPVYINFWIKHKDVTQRTPLLQEQVFDVPYTLPSGRIVRLRGKFDSVDLLGKGKGAGIYLKENKTKGEVNPEQIKRQLSFDLQTMFYLVTLETWQREFMDPSLPKEIATTSIKGVLYNVIRRPLSGGAGSIRQHKPSKGNPDGESKTEFYERLRGVIEEDADNYFFRWKCEVSQSDIEKFKTQFLNPCLENLLDDYEWWSHALKVGLSPFDYNGRSLGWKHDHRHFRLPFGIWNPMIEAGFTDLDEYLLNGSMVGLERNGKLFTELEE